MIQTCKPKAAEILLLTVGAGIPAFLLLVMILVFLRGTIDPLTSEKTDFGIILLGFVLSLFAFRILPIIGGSKAIRRKRWPFYLWISIITLIYIPALATAFGVLAVISTVSLAPTIIYFIVAVIPLLAMPPLVLIACTRWEFA